MLPRKEQLMRYATFPALIAVFFAGIAAAEPLPKGVACLLDENGAELLPLLTNSSGDGGEGEVEGTVVFSGKSAIKITAYQKYFNFLPGWAYRIAENPKEGENRYLRFAWKGEGLSGIMLQFHDDKDWTIRYTAGANKFGWATKFAAEIPPAEWTVVTVDLFKDFGEREIHGIALTAFDGVGCFDHIYLARTVAELDAIDATGLADRGPLKLTTEEVASNRNKLASTDAAVAYRAFWTLVAGEGSTRAALTKAEAPVEANNAKVKEWLTQLDHDGYAVREKATTELMKHLAFARKHMEEELKRTRSAEVRARLGAMLALADQPLTDEVRVEQQTRRILKIIGKRSER
jgi:hypothetical protein